LGASADDLPLLAALNALIKVLHALLDVVTKHIVFVDLGAAPLDDLIRDLGKQALHALVGVVVLAQLPDHTHSVENVGQKLGNIFGLSILNLAARLAQKLKEGKVVACLLVLLLNLLLKQLKARQVGAVGLAEDFDDFLEFRFFQTGGKQLQVGVSLVPMADLIQRRGTLAVCLRVLV